MNELSYEPAVVRRLFDEMSQTYGIVNLVSSFGFAALWRKQCVRRIDLRPGWTAVDMMSGMGELCPDVARRIGATGIIWAIDLSPEMCRRARERVRRLPSHVEVLERDVLHCDIASSSADVVFSSFGLKTFSAQQLSELARQIAQVLKPGGSCSLLEISVPPNPWIRIPYMFYVKTVIPLIGKVMLGNPENYRMLGQYTIAFGNCARMKNECDRVGLISQETSHFFGCATGVFGRNPSAGSLDQPLAPDLSAPVGCQRAQDRSPSQ